MELNKNSMFNQTLMLLRVINYQILNQFPTIGKKSFLLFCLFIMTNYFFAQQINQNDNPIVKSLDKIKAIPSTIKSNNSFNINNKDGHIQGVQYIKHNQTEYYVLSGSSDAYSYFSIVKTGDKNEVISLNKILDKPFKHAGGFQIYNNLMAIGIEDNDLKNRSKVIIYDLVNPEQPTIQELAIIERSGIVKRATAGCVAINEVDNYILVIVGDWNTKHLDFYKIKKKKLGINGEGFELIFSMDTEKIDKTTWVDQNWLPYQNINLIKDSSGHLFLAGLASNSKENILDLFKVYTKDLTEFSMVKIYSKNLSLNKNSNFQWGAGIQILENNKFKILSSGSHIENPFYISLYK